MFGHKAIVTRASEPSVNPQTIAAVPTRAMAAKAMRRPRPGITTIDPDLPLPLAR